MLDNHKYDLVQQLCEESKSLWRIENEYLKNAGGHDELVSFWEKLKSDKEEHIAELRGLVKEELEMV